MQFKTAISIPLLLRKESERRLGWRVNLRVRRVAHAPCRRVMRRRCVPLHCHTALSLCRVQKAGIFSGHTYLLFVEQIVDPLDFLMKSVPDHFHGVRPDSTKCFHDCVIIIERVAAGAAG